MHAAVPTSKRRGGARRHQSRFDAGDLGNARTGCLLKLAQLNVMAARRLHRLLHFRRHQRSTQVRENARCIDNRTEAEPRIDAGVGRSRLRTSVGRQAEPGTDRGETCADEVATIQIRGVRHGYLQLRYGPVGYHTRHTGSGAIGAPVTRIARAGGMPYHPRGGDAAK